MMNEPVVENAAAMLAKVNGESLSAQLKIIASSPKVIGTFFPLPQINFCNNCYGAGYRVLSAATIAIGHFPEFWQVGPPCLDGLQFCLCSYGKECAAAVSKFC